MKLVLAVVLAVALMEVSATQYPKLVLNRELSEVLHNAQSLLRSHIMEDNTLKTSEANLHLENMFLQISEDTVADLYNVTLLSITDLSLESVKPNLDQMNMQLDVIFRSLQIQGDFEIVSSSAQHIATSGKFSLDLTDLKATGRVGLSLEEDTLSTINYDIDYEPADKSLTVSYNTQDGEAQSTIANTEHFEVLLQKNIDRELRYVLNQYLKKELDRILAKEYLTELIEDNRMIDVYRAHVQEQRDNVNAMVDNILEYARSFLTRLNMQEISIPSFNSSFSKKVLFVTWHGELSLSDGYLNNLTTLERTGDVSYSFEGYSSVVVFGSFGMHQLKMGYNNYAAKFMNIGPTGNMSVDIGSHSLFLKITAKIIGGLSVNDVRVEYINDVQVHLTGFGLLNWLTSKIVTWVIALFKGQIADKISTAIKTALHSYTGYVNLLEHLI